MAFSKIFILLHAAETAGERNTRLNARLITSAPLCSRIRTTAVNIYSKDSPYDHSEETPGIPRVSNGRRSKDVTSSCTRRTPSILARSLAIEEGQERIRRRKSKRKKEKLTSTVFRSAASPALAAPLTDNEVVPAVALAIAVADAVAVAVPVAVAVAVAVAAAALRTHR